MGITELFSKRQKRLRGDVPDVYTYDNVPNTLKVQIVHIIKDCIGEKKEYSEDYASRSYQYIYDTLCREYGKFTLIETKDRKSFMEQLFNFFLQTNNIEEALDVIELSFKYIDQLLRNNYNEYIFITNVKISPDEAIEELNERFKEHGIGYSFDGGEIIRIDSTYTHSEITKPTIALLWNDKFKGANEEYLKAHQHYRFGRNKECLTECLKAFESTMKIICDEKGWIYDKNNTSRKLIQICFQNDLVPSYTQNQFTSLQNLLESGIPTIRNKLGGHGQGQIPQRVDDEMTRYGLNLTGTNIIFLIEQSGIK